MSNGERPLRITHVITGLEVGGAEMMLCKLLSSIDRERFDPTVISLSDLGPLAARIAALGIPVSAINMRRGRLQTRPLARLARGLAARRPQIVHTWIYQADLLGGLLAHATGDAKVVWGVRASLDRRLSRRNARIAARLCAATSSRLPDRIVSCSQRLAELHVELGYDAERMRVIPNGFDLSWFAPRPELRSATRQQLGLHAGAPVVGIVARYHPQKDHRTFVRAAAAIASRRADARFLLCGADVDRHNVELTRWIADAGIADRCLLLGPERDTRAVFNALDVLVSSSSFGEGFPNVLGEAMACGVPCVTTDVGDSATIVADTGRVVAPADPVAIAQHVCELLALPGSERAELAAGTRTRVAENYDLQRVSGMFQALYLELAGSSSS